MTSRISQKPLRIVSNDNRPDLYELLSLSRRPARSYSAGRPEAGTSATLSDLDTDLRIIGLGLLAGYLFVVIFRLAQMGWLS
jgi:hypothetical protein